MNRVLHMNKNQIYFISGVCGSGKSSTLKHLKNMLPADTFDIRDFDERGVPDGGGQIWHDRETRHWLDTAMANAKEGKSTIICGFANPEQFKKVHNTEKDIPAELFLLNLSAENIRKRLYGRHSTPKSIEEIERASAIPLDRFIEGNVSFAPELKSIFEKNGSAVIETDDKSPEEVAREIVKIISLSPERDR